MISCAKCEYKEVCDSLPDDLTCEEVIRVYEDGILECEDGGLEVGFDPYLGCYTGDV